MYCFPVRSVRFILMVVVLISTTYAMEGIVKTLSGGGYPHVGDVEGCVDDTKSLDGNILYARFNYPWGIVYDKNKTAVYVADCGCPDTRKENDRIRKVNLQRNIVTTSAGGLQGYADGVGGMARFSHIAGMALDQRNQKMYIADSGNDVIRVMDLNSNKVATFAGHQREPNFKDGVVSSARFNGPQQLELHESSTRMFVGDTDNHAVRVIMMNEKPPSVRTITGGPDMLGFQDGSLKEAKWQHPTGVAFDAKRNALYVSDHYNHAVRKVDLKAKRVTTLAGNGLPGNALSNFPGGSTLNYPEGIVHDPVYDVLYFAEFTNNRISMIKLSDNSLHVLAGGKFGTRDAVGQDAQFYHPTSLDFDPERKLVYVTDQYNHRIRTVTTLGNSEIAHPSIMIVKHLGKLDAYRDLAVHNRNAFSVFSFVTLVSLLILLLLCTRRVVSRMLKRNSPSRYEKLTRQP